jgi:hypothetical protein
LKAWTRQTQQKDKTNCFVSSTGASSAGLLLLEKKVQGKVTSLRKQLKAALQGTLLDVAACIALTLARVSVKWLLLVVLVTVKQASRWHRERNAPMTVGVLIKAVDQYVPFFEGVCVGTSLLPACPVSLL